MARGLEGERGRGRGGPAASAAWVGTTPRLCAPRGDGAGPTRAPQAVERPVCGDAAGLHWGRVDWVRLPVRDSQKSHRRRGLPAPPGGSGGVASGLLAHGHWEGRSLPTGERLSPGSRTTAGLGQASPLWQRPRHRAALVTGCRAPGLGASVGGRERQPDTARPRHGAPALPTVTPPRLLEGGPRVRGAGRLTLGLPCGRPLGDARQRGYAAVLLSGVTVA